MAGSVNERLAALQAAVDAANWDAFEEAIRSWVTEQPDHPWLTAGLELATAVRGGDTAGALAALSSLDARLIDLVSLVSALRAGDRAAARPLIVQEIAAGNPDNSLLAAFRWAEPGLAEPVKYLFSTPHLVAGCILKNGQITSMAAKGSRMSADSLGQRTDQIWSDLGKLNARIDVGIVESVEVRGQDGGWVLAATADGEPKFATALTAVSSIADEALARAQVVVAGLESEHD